MATEKKPKEKATPKEKVMKYYYSRSAGHTLAGFRPEARFPDGRLKHGDIAIHFQNHWLITNDSYVQRFVENHPSFQDPPDNPMIKEMSQEQFGLMLNKQAQAKLRNIEVSRQDYGEQIEAPA